MRPENHVSRTLSLIALLALSPFGCGGGDELPREALSGAVTFDGQPLKAGSIQFEPTVDGAVASGGIINDGQFEVAKTVGPVPGKYKVMIFAVKEAGAAKTPDEAPKASGPRNPRGAGLIPLRYNFQSELTADVKSGGPNNFTFDLKK